MTVSMTNAMIEIRPATSDLELVLSEATVIETTTSQTHPRGVAGAEMPFHLLSLLDPTA